jgi:hypothetical protein
MRLMDEVAKANDGGGWCQFEQMSNLSYGRFVTLKTAGLGRTLLKTGELIG